MFSRMHISPVFSRLRSSSHYARFPHAKYTNKDGIVVHPKVRGDIVGRPDRKQWDAAWEKERGCIEAREVLSRPMRLSALRALGIKATNTLTQPIIL